MWKRAFIKLFPPFDLTSDSDNLLCLSRQLATTTVHKAVSIPHSSSSTYNHLSQHHTSHQNKLGIMTRTHKGNDRDHVGLANGTAGPQEHLPRYFAKSGYSDVNPASTKKQGGGKGNWGQAGMSELEDYTYNPTNPKRRSNSTSAAAGHSALKTKFEAVDPEAVVEYDEEIHGPDPYQHELEKMSTSSSADTMGSVEEEEMMMVEERK